MEQENHGFQMSLCDQGHKSSLNSLQGEAEKLFGLISYCKNEFIENRITDYDFVGIYILAYLSMRKPKRWSNGKLPSQISTIDHSLSIRVMTVPELFGLLNEDYVCRKIGAADSNVISVMDIFNSLQFNGIKKNKDNYVNHCMVQWAMRNRPCKLLFRIPNPLEVLRQQANKERVVTIFTTREELSREHKSMLYYMDGLQNHSKDALEFLIHDLKHMENFIDPDSHAEQVGFFRCMLRLDSGRLRSFFLHTCGYDEHLWKELEYVISDM